MLIVFPLFSLLPGNPITHILDLLCSDIYLFIYLFFSLYFILGTSYWSIYNVNEVSFAIFNILLITSNKF